MLVNRVLLVDDDTGFLNIYSKILKKKGYSVECAGNGLEGIKKIESQDIDLVITDMCMPKINGLEFIQRIKGLCPHIQIIVITGQGTIENAVEAMQKGAYSYLLKPVNIDELLLELAKVTEFLRVSHENLLLKDELASKDDYFIGSSPLMLEIKNTIPVIANSNSSVLITGESGTGKELIAKSIHQSSARSRENMIKVNCSALSESILESELFGHEKGAFTGANYTKKGRFELANGSTLFLDEIGDISPNIQVKLLRVIQEKEFERVGGTKSIFTDFRLISATNKNLSKEIHDRKFRDDLYYRLNVIPLHIPPLRERKDDIPALISYFSTRYAAEMGKVKIQFTDDALQCLINYYWPGNIRELKNLIERLTVFSNGFPFGLKDLPTNINITENHKPTPSLYKDAKKEFEINFILDALNKNDWNITKTADAIQLARKNLQAKIKYYDLK